MKTAKQKLIEYMFAREVVVYETMGVSGLHFKKEDKEIIESWSDKDCEDIWDEIKYYIDEGYRGFGIELCPFCFYDNFSCCYKCEYKYNHGVKCIDFKLESDYNKYYQKVDLSVKWYQDLIKKIEAK